MGMRNYVYSVKWIMSSKIIMLKCLAMSMTLFGYEIYYKVLRLNEVMKVEALGGIISGPLREDGTWVS